MGGNFKNGSNRNIKKEIIKLRNEAWENRKISSKGDEIYKIIEEKEKQITHKLCPYKFTNSELQLGACPPSHLCICTYLQGRYKGGWD
ncbi:hypothetical protein AGE29_00490 (plasmid) [Clostridium botulinum]|uniref:hypothetical protein n=1 Tax=Clostridium botulinum TaxID=1491 RepID=UPI000585ED6F|nr:hypothetical protein [Clostridium botulinum]AJE13475.1 hypothetical protein T259_4245 [Clostridium botulinum CDC_1436]AXG90325.1 hypothetical protein AGE29_00490 [Clostridium botulinum]RFM19523.1 hypothetical protein C1145_15180 [Clostridium botulinum]RFM20452.1 hypothetical protein C1146_17755 [Clostridium botulinum]